jgi:long-chain acyl-CoA synthetase
MSVDADGYLWFHGRATQIIVHDGSNVSPQEIEGVLLEHPAVESAGVVGVPDALHGENVCAYVVVHDGAARPRVDELIAFARERVGYKAPAEIVFIEAMPVTPAGKVDRPALRREA